MQSKNKSRRRINKFTKLPIHTSTVEWRIKNIQKQLGNSPVVDKWNAICNECKRLMATESMQEPNTLITI